MRDATRDRAENDRSDDHSDQSNETLAERLQSGGLVRPQDADNDAESDRNQDLNLERLQVTHALCVTRLRLAKVHF